MRWHHVAVTFEPHGSEEKTVIKFYKDHVQQGETQTVNGYLKQVDGVAQSCMGIGVKFGGWIDEFRISKGVLDVSEMLHMIPRGTTLHFR